MKEESENSLVVAMPNQLQSNMFGGESKVKKATSLDINNSEQADQLLNAMQNVDFKLNDCVDKVIEVNGFYATERDNDNMNVDTGEVKTTKEHVLILFDTKGKTYVTGSNSCYYSFVNIIAIKGMPTNDNILNLTPVKVSAKTQGHTYLKLLLAKVTK